MRNMPGPISDAYEAGVFAGSSAVIWRVTVEPDWFLNPEGSPFEVGYWPLTKVPIRWWQHEDNNQVEIEVPNVLEVTIQEDLDSIAASCNITIQNTWMDNNLAGRNDRLGQRGYFTPTQNSTAEARARWGEDDSPWQDILEGNALLRVYKGIKGPINAETGAPTLGVAEAVADGYLMLAGVFAIDDVDTSSAGTLKIDARNMGMLLLDQPIYSGLIPPNLYPLEYYRWTYETDDVNARAIDTSIVTPGQPVGPGDRRTIFELSCNDLWYPGHISEGGVSLHGHRGRDAIDGNAATFWISVGNSGPDRPFTTDWLQTTCGEPINAIRLQTWQWGYQLYISVMENNRWQGDAIIPYDHAPLIGNQPHVVDTGADIPYVASYGVGPGETMATYMLPRVYQAQRVRYTFRHHARSPWGPNYYRCGIREVRNHLTVPATVGGGTRDVTISPVFLAADALIDPTDLNRTGYITVSQHGQIDAFGDAQILPVSNGPGQTSGAVTSVRINDAGDGYWVMDDHGRITSYGNAGHFGDPYGAGFVAVPDVAGTFDFAVTHTGEGYWVVDSQGGTWAFGDAIDFGPAGFPSGTSGVFISIEADPNGMGYWLMDTNGVVQPFGTATDYGSWSETVLDHVPGEDGPAAGRIRANVDGDGYWILVSSGRVEAFGAATDHGQIATPYEEGRDFLRNYGNIIPSPTDGGYLIMQGDGHMFEFGDAINFGGPVPGTVGTIRRDGNIRDYTDIVRDLVLWSGFWLGGALDEVTNLPEVFGNLETTGAFPPDAIPMEFFDKKPPADVIKQIAEIVGYVFGINDDGSFFFHTPNWWNFGNFLPDGTHTPVIPELDERWNLTAAGVRHTKRYDRSEIIISTEEPTEALDDTVTTRFVPPNQQRLRGMQRPAIVVHGALSDPVEQLVMAELAAMHMWFRQRTANITGPDRPGLGINDQVRLLERTTGETNVFYVLSKTSSWTRKTGVAQMTLNAHWLGDRDAWAVALQEPGTGPVGRWQFRLSDTTQAVLQRRGTSLDNLRDRPFVPHATPYEPDPGGDTAGPPEEP